MSQKKTIFFLTSRFPYPLEKGDKLRAYYQIKSLSKKYNIVLCSLTEKSINKEWKEELEKYCTDVYIFKLNRFLIGLNLFKAVFNPKKPFQVAYFFQNKIYKQINKIITNIKPDAIYCQLIRTSEYVKNIHNIPKTLDYMDALSEGMFKREKIASGFNKMLYKSEGNRLKRYENIIFDYFNHHTIISEQDKHKIAHPQQESITIIQNGVDDYFFNFDCKSVSKEFDLVFIGNLSYAPNIESSLYLINEVLPLFKSKGSKINLLLAGANPSPKILSQIKSENIQISGWVDDIRENYCKGKIFVAPLFIGTGLQNKLLEAMALGVPCVTTSLANNALQAKPNEEILIANNSTEFFNQIDLLLHNPEQYEEVKSNAKNFVKNKYNWDNASFKIPIL